MKSMIVFLLSAMISVTAASQPKPLHMVVPFAPGNNADIIARAIAANYEKITNRTILIENKPGADTMIGVMHFKNNQREILLGVATSAVFNPIINPGVPYTEKDFETIIYVGTNPGLWVTRADSDINTPQDLLTKMPPLVGGYVTAWNYNLKSFVKERGIKSEIVHYKGANQLLVDIVNGNVKLGVMATNNTLIEMLKDNRVKVVGTAYSTDLTIEGFYFPSVSRALGIPQYNGFVTVDLNPNLSVPEKEQLRKDLWEAVRMSQSVLQSQFMINDMTTDPAQIKRRFDEYRRHVKKHTQQ